MNIQAHHIFYAFDIAKPSLLTALIAALLKHVWGVAMAGIMLGLIYRYGWFATTLMNFSAYRIIGRISYATFMCHLFVVKLLMSSASQPIYLSDLSIVSCGPDFHTKLSEKL